MFKGKKNLNSHCITGLFNDTVLPYLMLYLLGPLKSGEYRQGGA